MELIEIFISIRQVFGKLVFPGKIVGTFFIDAFMDTKNRAFFYNSKSMAVMRTLVSNEFIMLFSGFVCT